MSALLWRQWWTTSGRRWSGCMHRCGLAMHLKLYTAVCRVSAGACVCYTSHTRLPRVFYCHSNSNTPLLCSGIP